MQISAEAGPLELDFQVRAYDLGPDGRLTPRRLCDYLQEAAGRHAEALGFSVERLAADDLGWVMHRLRLRIHSRPGPSAHVRVLTWPSARTAVEAHRDFQVLAGDGTLLAEATTRWVVMRLARRRVTRLPRWMMEMPLPERQRVLDGRFGELPDAPPPLRTCTFRVRQDDLDMMGHTNNAVYVAWFTEAAPPDEVAGCELAELDVAFRAETRRGESITCRTGPLSGARDGERFAHRLVRGEDEVARAVSRWRRPG